MKIDILSLFPSYFENFLSLSILKKAQDKNIININLVDIREFSKDKHKKVDARPFGGGPGMVLMPEPVTSAIRKYKKKDSYVIYLSPQGKKFDFKEAEKLSKKKHLIFVCGHYEGIDERVLEEDISEEYSIGDFVLTNGCLAAMVVIDATIRFIPKVLGNERSVKEDSYNEYLFDHPHYTRPFLFEEKKVPEILISGNHKNIEEYRYKEALKKTKRVRKDLYEKHMILKNKGACNVKR